ncbi:Elongation of very long chain fatty acids protein 1 [Halotydeus destructor]|nr:Elongation of very long chain fatty acids protein 1 [Halotydeus destructor]
MESLNSSDIEFPSSTVNASRLHHSEDNGNLLSFIFTDIWHIGADPRIIQYPLMKNGPWLVLTILAIYLIFVQFIGPKLMKNRVAFNLKPVIFGYNLLMMSINCYFFVTACVYTNFGLKTWGCINIDPNLYDEEMKWKLTIMWFFMVTKFFDLFETVFFVLRKKYSQVTFLHVFHHCVVPIDVWVGFKYSPSESACFFPFVNSLVHTVMYFYYALSLFGPSIQPYLWWKKYLTQLQIVQLILVAVHCIHLVLIPDCNIPKAVFAIYFPQALLLVYLFIRFFLNRYLSTPSKVKRCKVD